MERILFGITIGSIAIFSLVYSTVGLYGEEGLTVLTIMSGGVLIIVVLLFSTLIIEEVRHYKTKRKREERQSCTGKISCSCDTCFRNNLHGSLCACKHCIADRVLQKSGYFIGETSDDEWVSNTSRPDSSQPVYAWRAWQPVWNGKAKRWELQSLAAAVRWPRGVITAQCSPAPFVTPFAIVTPFAPSNYPSREKKQFPHKNCECGIYGYATLNTLLNSTLNIGDPKERTQKHVIGLIKLWGKVLHFEKGFRAENAQICLLLCTWGRNHQGVHALADFYETDIIHVDPWKNNMLRSLQGYPGVNPPPEEKDEICNSEITWDSSHTMLTPMILQTTSLMNPQNNEKWTLWKPPEIWTPPSTISRSPSNSKRDPRFSY